jgi:hypothetical protein
MDFGAEDKTRFLMVDAKTPYRPGSGSFGFRPKRRNWRRERAFFLRLLCTTVILLSVTACSLLRRDGVSDLGSDTSLSGEAVLVCSRDCSDRGQCGVAESGTMVLLSSAGPATTGHNMAITDGTPVTIIVEEQREVVRVATGELELASFYQVNIPERGPGWAAGWCVGQ